MNNLEYIRSGDYFIPNLALSEQPQTPLGKYGRMRKTYLQEHYPAQLIPQMTKAAGIKEQLKITDQMRWIGLMNTIKAQVEKTIFIELLYN